MKKILLLTSILLAALCCHAKDYTPADIENVQLADAHRFLSDPQHILSEYAANTVNQTLDALRQETTAEVVAIVVPSIGDYEPSQFAHEILNSWHVGQKDKDNGAVLLVVTDQKKTYIATGYGLEGAIPDISARKILEKTVVPAMKEGNPDKALVNATALIRTVLTDPPIAAEIRSSSPRRNADFSQKREDLTNAFYTLISAIFIFLLIYFIFTLFSGKGKDNQQRSQAWRTCTKIMAAGTVLTAGTALPLLLISALMIRRARNRRIKCPNCKAKMRKLNEEEDNALLTPAQDFEEKINTVDYDVWVCPECNTIERFAYRVPQNKYTQCPRCHTIALAPVSETILVPATTQREGLVEKVERCRYCGFENRTRRKIPRKDNSLAAAAIIGGTMLGRSQGFGGGGFGGGFGGGSSGGGGGGTSW